MTEAGLFAGQRLELIDGDLIDKMGQNPPHAGAIQFVSGLLFPAFGPRRVRIQAPMEVQATDQKYNFPEPDLAVVANPQFAHAKRHPRGDEMLLVVEVAEASLRGDSTIKRDLYARAGVPEYWVLGLRGRKLIVHREPQNGKYTQVTTLAADQSVTIAGHTFRVADMLP